MTAQSEQIKLMERPQRTVSKHIKKAVQDLSWEAFSQLSRRGELHRDVLQQQLDDGEISEDKANAYIVENDMSYHINELIWEFQTAELDRLRICWDTMSLAEQRKALDTLTPLQDFKRRTWEAIALSLTSDQPLRPEQEIGTQ